MDMDSLCATPVARTLAEEGQDAKIGVSLLGLKGDEILCEGGFQSEEFFYPASVSKLFFLAYVAHLCGTGKLILSEELDRACHQMIAESDNDATSYVVDVVTGTTSGPELDDKEMAEWLKRRSVIQDYFASLGYEGIRLAMKTWSFDSYGREAAARHQFGYRNGIQPSQASILMASIVLGRFANPHWTDWMRKPLTRQVPADNENADSQAKDFIGAALPSGSLLRSKAGWTSEVAHDVAWFRLPNETEWVLSIFTSSIPSDQGLVRSIAKHVIEALTSSA